MWLPRALNALQAKVRDNEPLSDVEGSVNILGDEEKIGGRGGLELAFGISMPSAQLNGAWLISLSNETNTKSIHLDYSAFRKRTKLLG